MSDKHIIIDTASVKALLNDFSPDGTESTVSKVRCVRLSETAFLVTIPNGTIRQKAPTAPKTGVSHKSRQRGGWRTTGANYALIPDELRAELNRLSGTDLARLSRSLGKSISYCYQLRKAKYVPKNILSALTGKIEQPKEEVEIVGTETTDDASDPNIY